MYSLQYFDEIKDTVSQEELDENLVSKMKLIEEILFKDSSLDWREKKKPNFLKLNKEKSLELNSHLNKLCDTNYDTLYNKIESHLSELKNYSYFVDTLFNNCLVQPLFCKIYVRLVKQLIDSHKDLVTFIDQKITEYLNMFEGEKIKENDELSYDDFCKNNILKIVKGGYTQFLGELYNNELCSYKDIYANMKHFLNIIEVDDELLEDSILCFDKIIMTIKDNMNIMDLEWLKDKLTKIIATKKFPSMRLKFKLMNLYDTISSSY